MGDRPRQVPTNAHSSIIPKSTDRRPLDSQELNIRIAGGTERIRIATHIFTQPTELNAFADAVERGLRV